MTSVRDPYEILGVSENATQSDIKRAYRRLAKEMHPDVSSVPGTEERFKEVLGAYEILSDPRKRARHDAFRNRTRPPGAGPSHAEDISHVTPPRPTSQPPVAARRRNPWWWVPYKHPVLTVVTLVMVASLLPHGAGGTSTSSSPAAPRSEAGSPSATPASHVVPPSPSPSVGPVDFPMSASDMIAFSRSDVWAVGGDVLSPASEHWDGTTWKRVHIKGSGELTGVSGVASNDLWAVGGSSIGSSVTPPLIEHWDGAHWKKVASAHIGYSSSRLNSVSVLSSSDVWAVGWAGPEPLAEHWDGTSWSLVPVPTPFAKAVFLAVSADATNDVWAVGSSGGGGHPLIGHWTGGTWTVDTLSLISGSATLEAVHAFSPDDVWVAGTTFTDPTLSQSTVSRAFVVHWDGQRWTLVHETKVALLFGVKMYASSASDVWLLNSGQGPLEHWDGIDWKTMHLPQDPGGFSFFAALTASHGQVWLADGGYWRWNGSRWRST